MKRGAGREGSLSRQYHHPKPTPPRQRQHRVEHGNKDEFNEDTFGETALSGLDNEFHFGGVLSSSSSSSHQRIGEAAAVARPPRFTSHSLGDIDPAIAMVTTTTGGTRTSPSLSRGVNYYEGGLGVEHGDDDYEDDERPPGMSPEMHSSMDFGSGAEMEALMSGPTRRRSGAPPPPPYPIASSTEMPPGTLLSSPRRVLTLNEIEARLSQISLPTSSSEAPNCDGRWLIPHNHAKSTIISFPRYADDADERASNDDTGRMGQVGSDRGEGNDGAEERSRPRHLPTITAGQDGSPWERNRWILNKFEREGVARIHLSQLSTEHAEVEDYYYRAYAKRASLKRGANGNDGGIAPPLYLPLPTPRRRERGSDRDRTERGERSDRDRTGGAADRADTTGKQPTGQAAMMKEALASALGKKSASSSKRPRQQLVVPALTTDPGAMSSSGATYSTSAAVELIYQAVFRVEDAMSATSTAAGSTPANESREGRGEGGGGGGGDLERLQECRQEAIDLIEQQLGLGLTLEELSQSQGQTKGVEGTTGLTRFLGILSLPKAKKILGRALKTIDSVHLSERLLTRLVELFEYLDVCRVDASETDINLFVNCLLAGLVPHVAKATGWEEIESKLQLMMAKNSLPWIAGTKAGLVLFCIILSRGEILKAGGATGEWASKATRWSALVERLFDQLSDRLSELFGSLQGADGEFYGWQFMALLALNVDADRKRQMVMELRERILATANASDQMAIDNLNIFLNVLGLDASHLRGEQ